MTWFEVMLLINLLISLPLFILGIFWVTFVVRVLSTVVGSQGRVAAYDGRLAVMIPTYNEADNIEMCLRSLLSSDFPLDRMTVYLNDDASSDDTLAIAKEVMAEYPDCVFKVYEREHIGKAAGLQLVLSDVEEDICVLIDADTFVTSGCLRELSSVFADEETAAVSSCILLWDPKGWLEWLQSVEFSLSMLLQKGASAAFGIGTYLSGQVWAVRRKDLEALGGIPQGILTEDYEMFLRFISSGRKVRWSQKAIAYTRGCNTIRSLLIQRMRWWHGNAACLLDLIKDKGLGLFKRSQHGHNLFRFIFFDRFAVFFFSILVYPSSCYLFFYWMPKNASIFDFLHHTFFWFSALGPWRVLYMLPQWGVNWFTIFGVITGIFFFFLNLAAINTYRNVTWQSLIGAIFLFPYFLLILFAFPLSLPYYWRKASRRFVD